MTPTVESCACKTKGSRGAAFGRAALARNIARFRTLALKRSAFRPLYPGHVNQELLIMCDYSLHNVASRPAKVGDKLTTTRFPRTVTCGFCDIGEPKVAVCLLPGTEIAFEAEVERQVDLLQFAFFGIMSLFTGKKWWKIPHRLGRFRQINREKPRAHHDAIEFPDGRTILLTQLRAGQRATLLQMPARHGEEASQESLPRELDRQLDATGGGSVQLVD